MGSIFLGTKKPDFEELGEERVRESLAKGKWRPGSPTAQRAQAWLDQQDRRYARSHEEKTLRLGSSSVKAAWASVGISVLALAVSIVALLRTG